MIVLHKPTRDELWFRRDLLEDPATMSYNDAWGGTIPFPEEDWDSWYECWLMGDEHTRFYRFLLDTERNEFVGEIAFHFSEDEGIYLADIIVLAAHRGEGYGRKGLRLLCEAARAHGIAVLYDNIALGNPAIGLFLSEGFCEEYRTDDCIYLRKDL
ncbi:MAG: GNAT family N-acetyltransferase [Coriobacteriaceae bacterium]|nr:GNAT family N-acetyltransferase [Coriobacteriaceae bacterium]